MNFAMNHASGAESIARPLDLQSNVLPLCHGFRTFSLWTYSAYVLTEYEQMLLFVRNAACFCQCHATKGAIIESAWGYQKHNGTLYCISLTKKGWIIEYKSLFVYMFPE